MKRLLSHWLPKPAERNFLRQKFKQIYQPNLKKVQTTINLSATFIH